MLVCDKKIGRYIFAFPFIALSIMAICGLIYEIDESGYHTKPFYNIYLLITAIIPGIIAIKLIILAYVKKNYLVRQHFIAHSIYVAACITASFILENVNIMPLQNMIYVYIIVLIIQLDQRSRISTDPLTGVGNRNALHHSLQQKMKQTDEPLYLFMMDADRFKKLNDTYGHSEGDVALIQIAEVLKTAVPRSFTIIRYGGDEFAVVGHVDDEESALQIESDIRKTNEAVNRGNHRSWNVNLSIGHACNREEGVNSIPELISLADRRLYEEKAKKRAMRIH